MPAMQLGAASVRAPRASLLRLDEATSVSEPASEPVSEPEPEPAPSVSSDIMAPFSEMELAEQEAKLTALSEKWKRFEEEVSYQETIRSGFGPSPEIINGRTAMFFIIVGLITEYYTGQSMPQQVYTMLQTLSIVE